MNPEVREITSRAEWLAWRRGIITASRIGALFGCHKYLTREQLAAELRGANQGDNPAMRAGRILEPGVLVAMREEHPDWSIHPATTFHVDPALRFGCTPDAWFSEAGRYLWNEMDGLIQVKTVSPEEWEKWHGKPPLAYTLQCLAEMMLTGRTRGLLAVMIRSRSYPMHEFDVPRHPAAEARILAAVAEWWRAYDAGEIPAPADPAGLDEMLDDGSSKDLSGDNQIAFLLEERETLKQTVAEAEAALKRIDYDVKNRIGPARTAWLPGWQLSYPTIKAKEYTVPAREYRRLTVKRTESD